MGAKTGQLATELATFRRKRREMLEKHEGRFVLIKGRKVEGFYDTMEEAYNAGCQTFGLVPFLIKEVTRTDRVLHMVFTAREPALGSD